MIHDEIGAGELGGRIGVRDGDGAQSGHLRRLQAPMRIFDRHAAVCVHLEEVAELRQREQIEVGGRLSSNTIRG